MYGLSVNITRCSNNYGHYQFPEKLIPLMIHNALYTIDNTKITTGLEWEPAYTFEEGIHETIRWYLEYQDWVDRITSGDYQNYYQEMYGKA